MRDIGLIYGNSLYSLAKDEGLEEVILPQLEAIGEAFGENRSLFNTLDAPQISLDEKLKTVDEIFEGCHPYVINTVKLLAESRRCAAVGYMAKQYKKAYNKDHNISEVTAITAVALSPESEALLTARLEKLLSSRVALKKKVDPSILGGVVIRTDSMQINGGIRHRLDEIKKEIVR